MKREAKRKKNWYLIWEIERFCSFWPISDSCDKFQTKWFLNYIRFSPKSFIFIYFSPLALYNIVWPKICMDFQNQSSVKTYWNHCLPVCVLYKTNENMMNAVRLVLDECTHVEHIFFWNKNHVKIVCLCRLWIYSH